MIIPYLNMRARVTVGKVRFDVVHAIRIEETITEIGNKATIELPRNFKKLDGKPVLDYISAGDPVTIELGYNDKLAQEFKGYVAVIDAEMPLVLHCEDEFYPLKQNNWVKAYKSVTLKALLEEVVTGYKIDCPDAQLGKFEVGNASTYEVLRKVQGDYGLFSCIIDGTLIAGFSYDWQAGKTNRWIVHRQKNVRSSDLKWKRQKDYKTRIKVEYWEGKKKKVHYVGTPGQGANTVSVGKMAADKNEAHKMGEAVLARTVYDGFTGSISTFGHPRIHAGDTIELQDSLEPEKAGVYLVDKVTIDYNEQGWARDNSLAHRLDKID
jgi:hypothetical protein